MTSFVPDGAPIGEKSWQLGLVGFPLSHSLSPLLHKAALTSSGLNGEYRLFPIPVREFPSKISSLLLQMRTGKLDGLNITIPHKSAIIPHLDKLTESAAVIGAVNTISLQNGQLVGDNTDAPGFIRDLQRLGVILDPVNQPQTALVLGAGGASRAVCYALLNAGWHIFLAARNVAAAEDLARDLSSASPAFKRLGMDVFNLADLERIRAKIDLLVNTTPVGMAPEIEHCVWDPSLPLPPGAFVYDLVYNPPQTRLLLLAQAQELACASGLGMLIAQAALAFQRWTGLDAEKFMWKKVTA